MCPIQLYFEFAGKTSLVDSTLKVDCQEKYFNTTLETVLQEGIYFLNVSQDQCFIFRWKI